MAASMDVTIRSLFSGLGRDIEFNGAFSTTTTPTESALLYKVQATVDTAEALDLGGVTTPELVIIKAIANDLEIDCDYDAAFDADIVLAAGEMAVFKPAGTVYIKNQDAGTSVTYEYLVVGT